jgi:hypothetical protein
MKIKGLNLTVLCLIIMALCGCGKSQTPSVGSCTKPTFTYAFQTYATAVIGTDSPKPLLPAGDWHIEATIPGTMPIVVESLLVRNKAEIWMNVSQRNTPAGSSVYRYRTDTHEWTSFTKIEGVDAVQESLLVSNNGDLWGIGRDYSSKNAWPILSRYDDSAGQFRFIEDTKRELNSLNGSTSPPVAQFDQKGVLWMLLSQGKNSWEELYSFDPATSILKSHLDGFQFSGGGSLAIAPNGDIRIFDPLLDKRLIQYHPADETFRDDFIDTRYFWNVLSWRGDLFSDQSGKIWMGNEGWIDVSNPTDPVWYTVLTSPVFISDYYDGENQFILTTPSALLKSSNGWYWFSSPELGIVKLDAKTGEWCRFTTFYSPVVEDQDQNLWIVAGDKLYRLGLNP